MLLVVGSEKFVDYCCDALQLVDLTQTLSNAADLFGKTGKFLRPNVHLGREFNTSVGAERVGSLSCFWC